MRNKNQILKILIDIIAPSLFLGGTLALSLAAPKSVIAFKSVLSFINKNYKGKREMRPSELKKIFMKMKREQLVDYKEFSNGDVEIKILKKGIKKVLINNFDKIQFKIPKKWNKKFYVIIFDIPNSYKKQRDLFVNKLKELNFYQLQKSVYVFLYPPQEIIDFLASILNIAPYIRILEASRIENEKEILSYFNVKI